MYGVCIKTSLLTCKLIKSLSFIGLDEKETIYLSFIFVLY